MPHTTARPATYYSVPRLEAYTDAVFAIAATLLVLDLSATAFGAIKTDAQLWAALGEQWETFMAFGISFALLSGLWVIHMRQFRDIARADLTLLWLNNARLLFIVLIPFTTTLVGDYSEFYAGRMLLPINFFFAALFGVLTYFWAAARGGHLLKAEVKDDVAEQRLGGLVALFCGALTVALSPWLGSWAFLAYVLNGPMQAVLERRRKARANA
ncbi:TMEM175 family protein [Microbacterium sp.]|uniref:TMEM175 family protein n=1 Tax=Microbacterium sp. TaxID=51671 RepID=UPI003F71C013